MNAAQSNPEKNPEEWVTGDEPVTGPQASYLETLSREVGEQVSTDLTKREASRCIEELQDRTGRGGESDWRPTGMAAGALT